MAALNIEPRNEGGVTDAIKLIAFYLPQFHPIPENDAWWGKGFTEWTNVTKARPLFEGHYQPRLPADMGFYDLRLRETRRQQIALAKEHGVFGFCYHYYWFSGKRLLEEPVDDMLADPESDMPFCLCWANENWTRRWDAKEHEILIAQEYAPEDDEGFIRSVIPFLRDPRYIRLNGAPLLIVYRPQQLPDSRRSTQVWREVCKAEGIPDIHLCAALTHGNEEYRTYGFDSGVQFPPHNLNVHPFNWDVAYFGRFRGRVFKFEDVAEDQLDKTYKDNPVFKTVFPAWDNTARRNERATVILDGTPENYEFWLCEAIRRTREASDGGDTLVFINAWNEWAEGCYLEPDQVYKSAFLESTLRAATDRSTVHDFQPAGASAEVHATARASLLKDLADVVGVHFFRALQRLSAFLNRNPRLKKTARPLIRLGRVIFER